MAIKTTLEQLEEVQTAITAVMAAQAYEIGGRRITKATLFRLAEREEMLLQRYNREQGTGGPAINIGIPRRD